ncbi:MAG: hypothetical protein IPL74_15370 [Bacteroidetes bacterium]|nr:hypothetical protein [Bacteroidota bacterium]
MNPYDSIDFYYTAARHLVDSFVLNSNNEEVHKARINQIGILSMFAHYYDINENYLKSFQLIHECLMLSENVVDSGNLQMEQIWMHLPKLYQFDQEEF